MHVNSVHLKLRHLPCPWPGCVKSFGSNCHLHVHMHIHTGKKPLGCPHCDFRARQRHSLDYHLDRHHKDMARMQNVKRNYEIFPEPAFQAIVIPEQTINENNNNNETTAEQIVNDYTNNNEITPADTCND